MTKPSDLELKLEAALNRLKKPFSWRPYLVAGFVFLAAVAYSWSSLSSRNAINEPTAIVVQTSTETLESTTTPQPTSTFIPTGIPTSTLTPLPEGYNILPDLTGLDYQDAETTLLNLGYDVSLELVLRSNIRDGIVVDQSPLPGEAYQKGDEVTIYRTVHSEKIRVNENGEGGVDLSTVGDNTYFINVYLTEGKEYIIIAKSHLTPLLRYYDNTPTDQSAEYSLFLTTSDLDILQGNSSSEGRVYLSFSPEVSGTYGFILKTSSSNPPTYVQVAVIDNDIFLSNDG